MKRITPEVKAIADAHIEARRTGSFDNPECSTKEELLTLLQEGKTFQKLLEEIEIRYCTVTSILAGSMLSHTTGTYKTGIYRGFKEMFNSK